MRTVLDTAPAAEPILKAAAKTHLRIASAMTTDDDYIDALIKVARHAAEQWTRRRFITQTWLLYLDRFPTGDAIYLPFGSLSSVTHVKYTDSNETQSTLSSDDYSVDTASRIGRIMLDYGETWPNDTLWPTNPVEVKFVCGYGAAGSNCPDGIIHALKLMVADMYVERQTVFIGTTRAKAETIKALLRPYRLHWSHKENS